MDVDGEENVDEIALAGLMYNDTALVTAAGDVGNMDIDGEGSENAALEAGTDNTSSGLTTRPSEMPGPAALSLDDGEWVLQADEEIEENRWENFAFDSLRVSRRDISTM
ncbi:hypothetical protein CYMTET_26603 [Cymbomonas tetramitiformis]|uniref:Uncharacterized protein n=1 Tax=Cymbomonas tetramitiformis TaxID=36881 RepID=A0AAE0FT11_9CHLO|nr:hypothetical protein CYMTET_26603 [Cymbomonas tetramitiformis]